MKDPLFELFGIKTKELTEKFAFSTPEVNHQGALVEKYSKVYFDTKYHIFDTLDVKEFENCMNVFFISHKLHRLNLFACKKLLNRLYKLHGPDERKQGNYCTQDFLNLKNKNLLWVDIREWEENQDFDYRCEFFADKESNELRLIFYGLKKESKPVLQD